MKLFRRFCLILCALSVFLNVTLNNALHASTSQQSSSQGKSKQVAFKKSAEDLAFNPFESAEDVELDEDGSDFDQILDWTFYGSSNYEFTFRVLQSSKFAYFKHCERSATLPLFIKYENFRI